MGAFNVLSNAQFAGRVRAVSGLLVEIDEAVTMQDGTDYAIRFRQFASESDAIGTSVVVQVATQPGETDLLQLLSGSAVPAVGEVIHFGPLDATSIAMRVRAIQQGDGASPVSHHLAEVLDSSLRHVRLVIVLSDA